MKKILIIDNFLPNLDLYLKEIQKITTYNQEEFNLKFDRKETWPGKRSERLDYCSPFLFHFVVQNLEKVNFLKKYSLNMYVHLRREEDFYKIGFIMMMIIILF